MPSKSCIFHSYLSLPVCDIPRFSWFLPRLVSKYTIHGIVEGGHHCTIDLYWSFTEFFCCQSPLVHGPTGKHTNTQSYYNYWTCWNASGSWSALGSISPQTKTISGQRICTSIRRCTNVNIYHAYADHFLHYIWTMNYIYPPPIISVILRNIFKMIFRSE